MAWGRTADSSGRGRDGAYGVTAALQLVELAVPGQNRIGTPKEFSAQIRSTPLERVAFSTGFPAIA